jgi:hypothetical protein
MGERIGSDATNCTDSNGNGVPDCGSATSTGPGFTSTGSLGSGVWVKSRFDLGAYLGRRAQLRWIFGSLAFGDPTFLSYLETPGQPGAFDIDEKDDGWHIDDIKINGLLTNQLNLVVDGGDDQVAGANILCGVNLIAETSPVNDDVCTGGCLTPTYPVGATCPSALTVILSDGPDGDATPDALGTSSCSGNPVDFCGAVPAQVVARINNRTNSNFSTPYPGSPFVVDGGLSTLDKCESGSIQYEFTRCNTTTIGAACDAPANGTIVQGFSSDGQITAFPTANTRYRLRIRCSSQSGIPGCGALATATTDALVNVYPADDGGAINMTVTCTEAATGVATVCDPTDPLSFAFSKPNQSGNLSGFDLFRVSEASLTSADTPIMDGAICLVSDFGIAAPPGFALVVAEAPIVAPASRAANCYLVAHNQVALVGNAPAGTQRSTVTGTGINGPIGPRFLSPATCP